MKLDSKTRAKLPDEMFGLPDERKYPLHDESHVKSAIMFFRYCPPAKRVILANNINRRAKELGIKIGVSKDNAFYKLADKSILKEVTVLSNSKEDPIEELVHFEVPRFEVLSVQTKNFFKMLICKPVFLESEIVEIEHQLIQEIIPFVKNEYSKLIEKGEFMLNPVKIINQIMEKLYFIFLNYDFFIIGNKERQMTDIFYEIINDLNFTINAKIFNHNTDIKSELKLFEDLVANFNCNLFYIQRKLEELIFDCFIAKEELKKVMDINSQEGLFETYKVITIEKQLKELAEKFMPTIPKISCVQNSPKEIIGHVLKSDNLNLIQTEEYLNNIKNELKNQINIVLMSNWMSASISSSNSDYGFYLSEVPRENREIYDIIDCLSDSVITDNIKFYDKNYSLKLGSRELFMYSQLKRYITSIYTLRDRMGDPVYLGLKKDNLYLLAMNEKVDNELILVKLYNEGVNWNSERNFTTRDKSSLSPVKMIRINVTPKSTSKSMILTEGISVDKDGNVKLIISPKKTYMDEYAENHKLLVENYKNKNYEGMKRNLAFLFALINEIEREAYSKSGKKKGEEWYRNAMKARTFAINDFKTYLRHVQAVEKDFDFTKYYEESGYDKMIVSVPNESILGIKKLFRTIMLS